ncbi:hypothetical protein Pint_14440 [Pistacia integerrima]|uniref:Uncharacterized protein n=1 Tax=Pistacia integerrima TaxID=434235 RepID=A0ACC0YAF5_9ROSI|nr:hypothetical protein Pint_14440 [Pistacia integerrima]
MGKIKGFMHSFARSGMFDNVRIPKENLLNSIVDVSPDGEYLSAIKDLDQDTSVKQNHVILSAFKATFTLHNQRTLQECRGACGGQGLKTENHVGHLKVNLMCNLLLKGTTMS